MRKELLLLGAFGMLTTATLCARKSFICNLLPKNILRKKILLIFPDNTRSFPAIPCRTDLRCLYSVH